MLLDNTARAMVMHADEQLVFTVDNLRSAGDHTLMPDSIYAPTRHFCNTAAKQFGIETSDYDPTIGDSIEALFQSNT